jgi:isoprenylcysteine carboxyl methyltransferase (ICMT) family protein YpbQ
MCLIVEIAHHRREFIRLGIVSSLGGLLFSASSFKSASIRGGPQYGTRNSEYRKQLHTSWFVQFVSMKFRNSESSSTPLGLFSLFQCSNSSPLSKVTYFE